MSSASLQKPASVPVVARRPRTGQHDRRRCRVLRRRADTSNLAARPQVVTLRLSRPSGPLDGARVTVSYSMPSMNMPSVLTTTLARRRGARTTARRVPRSRCPATGSSASGSCRPMAGRSAVARADRLPTEDRFSRVAAAARCRRSGAARASAPNRRARASRLRATSENSRSKRMPGDALGDEATGGFVAELRRPAAAPARTPRATRRAPPRCCRSRASGSTGTSPARASAASTTREELAVGSRRMTARGGELGRIDLDVRGPRMRDRHGDNDLVPPDHGLVQIGRRTSRGIDRRRDRCRCVRCAPCPARVRSSRSRPRPRHGARGATRG